MKVIRLFFLVYFISISVFAQEPGYVYIVGTGGTIAGYAESNTSNNYEAGKLSTKEILKNIPEISQLTKIKTMDLLNINSGDITLEHWLTIAKNVNYLLQKDDVKGVVLTHGTDTMEETAYFLDLVVKSNKPVVVVGSMRPATSTSADGPINLYNAVAVAASNSSNGKGVLVVMNDQIFDARDVTKTHTTRTDTFNAPNTGPIGHVNYGEVIFQKVVFKKNTCETPFDVKELAHLPRVEIIYEYAGTDGALLKSAIERNVEGIVIAGSGNGNIAEPERNLLNQARKKGIVVVRSSRTGGGYVTYNNVHNLDREIGLIPANNLNPQKARILLMLALTKTKETQLISQYFSTY